MRLLTIVLGAALVLAARGGAEPARVFHIAPGGSDAGDGRTPATAWATFGHAIAQLVPGDILLLASGVYRPEDAGVLRIDCSPGGSARHGEPGRPILLRAVEERQALIRSDGARSPVSILDCSHWTLEGLSAESADRPRAREGAIFRIRRSHHLTLRRLLAHWPNRFRNAHGIAIGSSHHVTVEECEVYAYHRHGVSVYKSHHVVVRRCYVNSRGQPDHPEGYASDRPGGDESYVLYHTSDSIIENSIAEFETRGFEVHGGETFDGRPGGYRNRVLGSIHFTGRSGEHFGAGVDTRMGEGTDFVVRPAYDNLFKDFLILDASSNGVVLRSAVGVRLENVTIYNAAGSAIRAKERSRRFFASRGQRPLCGKPLQGSFFEGLDRSIFPGGVFVCSLELRNALVWSNEGAALRADDGWHWRIDHSNLVGNQGGNRPAWERIGDATGRVRHSLSVEPTGFGPEGARTLVYVPDGSNMRGAGASGADVGANILCRYQDGKLTDRPLWDPATGAFPCGAQLTGTNDAGRTCNTVHRRLHLNPATLGAALERCRAGSVGVEPPQGSATRLKNSPERPMD